MPKITFDRTKPAFGPHMDRMENYETSIFKEVYDLAAKNIGEIIDFHTGDKNEEIYYNSPECNNIVALVGERGSGKTSALHSIISFLNKKSRFKEMERNGFIKDEHSLKCWNQLREVSFFCLPVIDPTKMSNNETLIGSISARIYHEFNKWKDRNIIPVESYNPTLSKQRTLIQSLKEVNQAALNYASEKFPEANEDMLSQMEKVENLKEILEKMIGCFLELENSNFPGKKYFVISIDDLDMNVACSYKILEEIRKFLMVPNVIILISTSMTQLKKDVTKQFVQTLKFEKTSLDDDRDILWNATELAQQYLYKLLPIKHRCNLPALNNRQGIETRVEFGYAKSGDGIIRKDAISLDELPTIKNLVLHLIYRKTTLILMEDENNYHPIIPTTLRTLQQFLYFLDDLEDIPYSGDAQYNNSTASNWYSAFQTDPNAGRLKNNLVKLSDYILKNHLDINREHMSEESLKIASAVRRAIYNASNCSIRRLNANIVRELILAVPEEKRRMYFGTARLTIDHKTNKDQSVSLLEATYLPETISMGDVMFTLGKIHKKSANQELRDLIVLLRTMWSIRATECFFSNSIKQIFDGNYEVSDDFRVVIGGFMINPDGISFFHNTPVAQDDWHRITERELHTKLHQDKNKNCPSSALSVSVISDNSANFVKWRQQYYGGNIYYKTQYIPSEGADSFTVLCNYFSVFTNLLTIQKTIDRVFLRTGYSLNIPDRLKQWFLNYYMIFPFCYMECMDAFYNVFRSWNNILNQPHAQISLHEKVKSLWTAINNSVAGNDGIYMKISCYIDQNKLSYLCDAVTTCPLNSEGDSKEKISLTEQLIFFRNGINPSQVKQTPKKNKP